MQFATTGDPEFVGVSRIGNAQRDVVLQLPLQAFADLAAGDDLPSLPAKGDLLTWKVMLTVGSSTDSGGNASRR